MRTITAIILSLSVMASIGALYVASHCSSIASAFESRCMALMQENADLRIQIQNMSR